MKKSIILLATTLLSLGAMQATPTYEKCPGESQELKTTKTGDSYQWYKDGKPISGATEKSYTVKNISADATYKCVTTKQGTTVDTGNMLSLGGFEFDNTNQNKRPSVSITDPLRNNETYSIEYLFDNLNLNGKADPGEYCTSTDPSSIKSQYFTSITAKQGSKMLVVNGAVSYYQFKVFHVRNLKLKGGVTYQFSCWAANIDKEYFTQNHGSASLPQIKFEIEAEGHGTKVLGGGYMTLTDELGVWQEYKGTFTPNSDCNWAHITIYNTTNTTVAGNNFVLDDIYFGAERRANHTTEEESFNIKLKNCATSADRVVLALETFKTPNTNPTYKVEDLHRNVSTAYTYQSNKETIAEEQYAIIKNTESTWPGWYKDNGAKIVYGNTQNNEDITDAILTQHNQTRAKNTDNDGFMVVNCNTNKYVKGNPTASKDAIIFEYNVYGICPNVYHDFSAFISNLDATEGHAGINVLFEVTEIDANGNEINPSNPIFTKETGYIACGDQSWKEFGCSFINGSNTNVKLRLYNNNQIATPNFGGNIIGNDVAIDDVTLSRIIPRINVYFNEELTSFTSSDACNNKNTEIKLYVGNHNYIINDLLPGGYYIVEQRVANSEGKWGAWTPVMTEPKALTTNAFEEVTATIKEGQGVTQYRAVVAPTAKDVEIVRAKNNAKLPGCSIFNITKEDSYAQLTYQCTDIPTQITENESSSIEIQYIDNKIIVTGIDAQTQISVINIIGKTIYEDTTTENQYTIDLNPYHSGIYIVKIGNQVERIRKY